MDKERMERPGRKKTLKDMKELWERILLWTCRWNVSAKAFVANLEKLIRRKRWFQDSYHRSGMRD